MADVPSNAFNEAVAKFGFVNALGELRMQCSHWADVADDHDNSEDTKAWTEMAIMLSNAFKFAMDNGLRWPNEHWP